MLESFELESLVADKITTHQRGRAPARGYNTEPVSSLQRVGGTSAERVGDLVFIYGLGGDPKTTWCASTHSWWCEWVAADLPTVGVFSLGYDASPSGWLGNTMSASDRAINLLALLRANSIGERPLCFIAHSLGGLLIKQMLRTAATVAEEYEPIVNATKGVMFLSTPHSGSELASFVSRLGFLLRPTSNVDELVAQAPQLRELNLWYRNNARKLSIQTRVLYEGRATQSIFVVSASSADPGIEGVVPVRIDADHFSIAKPATQSDLVYVDTLKFVRDSLVDNSMSPSSAKQAPALDNAEEPQMSRLRGALISATTLTDLLRLSNDRGN